MLPRCLLCLVSLCPRCAAAVPTLPCGGTPVLHRLLRTRSTPTWLTAWGAACCGSCGRQALAAVLRASPSLLPHASAFAALSSAFVLQFPEKNNQLPLYASPVQRFCNTPSIPWAACRHFPASGPLLRPPTPALACSLARFPVTRPVSFGGCPCSTLSRFVSQHCARLCTLSGAPAGIPAAAAGLCKTELRRASGAGGRVCCGYAENSVSAAEAKAALPTGHCPLWLVWTTAGALHAGSEAGKREACNATVVAGARQCYSMAGQGGAKGRARVPQESGGFQNTEQTGHAVG